MGPPLSERPPVPTESQRLAAKEADRAARDIKQAANGRLVAGRRAAERRRLEEIARQEQRAERALYEAQKSKREEAELKQRQEAAELLIRYEMLDKDMLKSFAGRLSRSLEKQTSFMVSLADHLQEAKTSLEQGRRFHGSFQKELNRVKKEMGSVIEKPQEQTRLEVVISSIQLMTKEAQFKITRLENYLERTRGQEHQLRDTDAKLLEKAHGVTSPEDFAWINIIKELELTENEKKAARLDLHKTGPTTAAITKKQKAVKKAKQARPITPKNDSNTATKPPPGTPQPVTPEIAEEAKEEPKQKGGIFGWFGR